MLINMFFGFDYSDAEKILQKAYEMSVLKKQMLEFMQMLF